MTVLALKVALAPLLVVLATLSGRRWGAAVAGVVTAVPVVAGPILAIITIEHGRAFGAEAARASLLGVVALCAFCVAFARAAAAGRRWPAALLRAYAAFAVVAAVASRFDAPPLLGFAAALLAIAAARVLITVPEEAPPPSSPPPAWDLPARVALTIALVVAITGAAGTLGPALSGVLTPFPIATTVVVAFSLAQDGPAASRSLLRGFVRALPGFALCFFLAALAL
jgi:hypothetical protein